MPGPDYTAEFYKTIINVRTDLARDKHTNLYTLTIEGDTPCGGRSGTTLHGDLKAMQDMFSGFVRDLEYLSKLET